jgi:hypothetical protein
VSQWFIPTTCYLVTYFLVTKEHILARFLENEWEGLVVGETK